MFEEQCYNHSLNIEHNKLGKKDQIRYITAEFSQEEQAAKQHQRGTDGKKLKQIRSTDREGIVKDWKTVEGGEWI